jgi:hypothetical protein
MNHFHHHEAIPLMLYLLRPLEDLGGPCLGYHASPQGNQVVLLERNEQPHQMGGMPQLTRLGWSNPMLRKKEHLVQTSQQGVVLVRENQYQPLVGQTCLPWLHEQGE